MYLTNVILGVATIFRRLQTIKALVQSAKVQRAQYEKCEWAGLKQKPYFAYLQNESIKLELYISHT